MGISSIKSYYPPIILLHIKEDLSAFLLYTTVLKADMYLSSVNSHTL